MRTLFIIGSTGMLCLSGCADRQPPSSATAASTAIRAEFLYLPANDRTIAEFTADSISIERRNSKDSCIGKVRRPVSDSVASKQDSLRLVLAAIPAGTYKKDGVIDGTKITIRYGGFEIVCDKCLNDFVMEAAGAAAANPSKTIYDIKEAVRLINGVILSAEKTAKVFSRYEVVLPREQNSGDTARYRVEVVQPPKQMAPLKP